MLSTVILDRTADKSTVPPSSVRIKELAERDRRSVLLHFLALEASARTLRFASTVSDEQLTRYVQKINFSRDILLGVYDDALKLVAVGHLAYTPRGALPNLTHTTASDRIAELGVSVLAPHRGQGLGTRLFERATMYCRHEEIDVLYVHCLNDNAAMIHIAKKAGMSLHFDRGEADAYLKLPPLNAANLMPKVLEEKTANFEGNFKATTPAHAISQSTKPLPSVKRK